jgi:hypothetical protein
MWNTGCAFIENRSGNDMCVFDQEADQTVVWPVDLPRDHLPVYWNETIFPWCINSGEVYGKAFRFYNAKLPKTLQGRDALRQRTPAFYMFQYYRDDQIYYLRPQSDGSFNWTDRVYCGEGPSSVVSVSIPDDGQVHVFTVGMF